MFKKTAIVPIANIEADRAAGSALIFIRLSSVVFIELHVQQEMRVIAWRRTAPNRAVSSKLTTPWSILYRDHSIGH